MDAAVTTEIGKYKFIPQIAILVKILWIISNSGVFIICLHKEWLCYSWVITHFPFFHMPSKQF